MGYNSEGQELIRLITTGQAFVPNNYTVVPQKIGQANRLYFGTFEGQKID